MIRINYIRQAIHLLVFQIIQIPLLYKLILFDKAFVFFYIGFILLLPYGLNRSIAMIVAFFSGILIDVFSNTPGIHAAACVFIAYVKDYWLNISNGVPEDDLDINLSTLGFLGYIKYVFPLIFIHHLIIFTIENGGLGSAGMLFGKVIYSAIFSFLFILTFGLLMAPKRRRI